MTEKIDKQDAALEQVPTPRTDECIAINIHRQGSIAETESAYQLCRTLERSLSAATTALAEAKAKNAALLERLMPSLEYVEETAVGYGEDEIDRLNAALAEAQCDRDMWRAEVRRTTDAFERTTREALERAERAERAEAELAKAKHDIERHVQITTDLTNELGRVREERDEAKEEARQTRLSLNLAESASSERGEELLKELEGARKDAFQNRVRPWMLECFGQQISADTQERNHRFLEEALELVQSCGATNDEAHQLVDYVYGRPVGDRWQEIGGVMVTLAALCLAQGLNMHEAGEDELTRIWTKIEQIRAKQAAKPKHSPLPEAIDAAIKEGRK